MERVVQHLRGIVDISVCYPEIFILETSRTVIRIAPEPEIVVKRSFVEFPLWRNSESEEQDEVDCSAAIAEESYELPPIG